MCEHRYKNYGGSCLVDWFNNRRWLERIGYVAPVEAEQTYYASLMDKDQAA
ncbi:hypothetical protein [Hafnia alvei]|uniref:hypothetical protein n=1 Tax=Hafnia alvei TaxID=569 RepID=UPI00187D2F23|nr:hypothetical protein [Hafnia alvei]MDU3154587.1 hypothetical protein [Hafnia alvei]